jgi:hypothetical protein
MLVATLVAAVAAQAAFARRAPTGSERTAIVKALPAFYHQKCIRYSIRVSTVDTRYAAVSFRFVPPRPSKTCSPFDGGVLMKRIAPGRWKKTGEGSEWPCAKAGAPTPVIKDLFGGCVP